MPSPEISFRFDPAKAAEAAALLLRLHGGPMGRMRLLKLLYLAEREALKRSNRPICGGLYVSMPHGPVMSEVYDLIRGQAWGESAVWNARIVAADERDLMLRGEIDPDSLSDADIAVLKDTFRRFKHMTDGQIYRFVHDPAKVPEYRDPEGSSAPIPAAHVLEAVGKTAPEIVTIAEEVRVENRQADLLSE